MTTFIDTNAVMAMLDPDHVHHAWSTQAFDDRRKAGPVILSDIVYCEVSVAMTSREAVDEAIARFAFERYPLDDDSLFKAGKAYKRYKDVNKGPKLGVMPDFLIGASAETHAAPLITANARDFTGYFNLELITPPSATAAAVPAQAPAAAAAAAPQTAIPPSNPEPQS